MPRYGSIGEKLTPGERVYDWRFPDVIGEVVEQHTLAGTKFIPWVTVRFPDDSEIRLPLTRWVRVVDPNSQRKQS